jgi:uncharacterized Fe-S cluster-containing radical SAM superfamily protein
MNKLYNTHSLCHICFRHLPAEVYVKDNVRYIRKICSIHGTFNFIQDPDAEFCEKLTQRVNKVYRRILMLETTDKCNLKCPHCYHIPNNKKKDLDLLKIYDDIKFAPPGIKDIILAGAEPTMRDEIFDLIDYCNNNNKTASLLTNGVRLHDIDFVKKLKKHNVHAVEIGLNHPTYQGEKIHKKQLQGIKNCIDVGVKIHYIGYTVEKYDHLSDILKEIKSFPIYRNKYKNRYQFRIRLGSDIGRIPNEPTAYISTNYKEIEKVVNVLGHDLISGNSEGDDNMYHMFAYVDGRKLRIIQWPDAKNIDMSQLKHSPWAKFNRQNYITNFVHQVITRDAYVNRNLPVLDSVPNTYKYSLANDGI